MISRGYETFRIVVNVCIYEIFKHQKCKCSTYWMVLVLYSVVKIQHRQNLCTSAAADDDYLETRKERLTFLTEPLLK